MRRHVKRINYSRHPWWQRWMSRAQGSTRMSSHVGANVQRQVVVVLVLKEKMYRNVCCLRFCCFRLGWWFLNGGFIWSIHSLKLLNFKQSQSILSACDKVGMVVVVVCCGTTTESICSQRSFLQGAFNYRLNHQPWLPSYIDFFGGWFPFRKNHLRIKLNSKTASHSHANDSMTK